MSQPSDHHWDVPNLSNTTASSQEESRSGDPSRFFPALSASQMDSITARILNLPRASVYRNSGIAPVSGVPYIVEWDSVEENSHGMWSALDPTKLTAKVAGWYGVWGWGQWAADATVTRRMLLTKVDAAGVSTLYSNPGNEIPAVAAGLNTDQHIDYPVPLQAGEYVTLTVEQFSSIGAVAFDGATVTSRVNGFVAILRSTFGTES